MSRYYLERQKRYEYKIIHFIFICLVLGEWRNILSWWKFCSLFSTTVWANSLIEHIQEGTQITESFRQSLHRQAILALCKGPSSGNCFVPCVVESQSHSSMAGCGTDNDYHRIGKKIMKSYMAFKDEFSLIFLNLCSFCK